jgi:23S rRNA pseudouridine1911/1915/1917 synthase
MTNTLVNALLHHCKDLSGIGGEIKPGIVHRLDKHTSGVMVAAKNDKAHLGLAAQFKVHSIERAYLALVWGKMERTSGRFETKIGRNPQHRLKMTARVKEGRTAITEWSVKKYFGHCSLVECRLYTGRTHQIRVHLSESGHPLVGDELYGRGRTLPQKLAPELVTALDGFRRQALHAFRLGFDHPVSGERMTFSSEPPEDMKNLILLMEKFDK